MQLRHGVMTMMGDNGLQREGSHLLGHSKLKTSLTHYDHEQIERLAIVAKRMEQIDPRPDDDDSDAAGAVTAA
jgi:integrase